MAKKKDLLSAEVDQYVKDTLKKCDCGRAIKHFMHNCPNSHDMTEVFGCPKCNDECGFCKEE